MIALICKYYEAPSVFMFSFLSWWACQTNTSVHVHCREHLWKYI